MKALLAILAILCLTAVAQANPVLVSVQAPYYQPVVVAAPAFYSQAVFAPAPVYYQQQFFAAPAYRQSAFFVPQRQFFFPSATIDFIGGRRAVFFGGSFR